MVEALKTLAAGASPATAARARRVAQFERAENTFGAVALEWIDSHGVQLVAGTLKRERSMLDRFLLPALDSSDVAGARRTRRQSRVTDDARLAYPHGTGEPADPAHRPP